MKKIRMARDGYVLISIIFYIVGIVCMTIPSISPLVLCITGGIILVAYGIVKIIGCGFFAEGLMNHLTVKETVKIAKQIQGQEKNEEDTDWEE